MTLHWWLGIHTSVLEHGLCEESGQNREYTRLYGKHHFSFFPLHHRSTPEFDENVIAMADHIGELESGILPVQIPVLIHVTSRGGSTCPQTGLK